MDGLKPVVSIVTPCFNAEKYIPMTLESVLEQTAFKKEIALLDYIIVDGGSTDGTLPIINKIVSAHPLRACVRIYSEPDKGMYDALVKGMLKAKGDIFAYINADDYYHITAVEIVITIMKDYPVKWLTGWAVGYNEEGHITGMRSQYVVRKRFMEKGVYGTRLPHLQQESTFWRRELNETIDKEKLRNLKYAGDYYLWVEFIKENPLYVVETYLGGFRSRAGQLSEGMDRYREEQQGLTEGKIHVVDKVMILKDKVAWKISRMSSVCNYVKNEGGKPVHIVYDRYKGKWVWLDWQEILGRIKRRIKK
jgi:glycosyltransferase involved in cell wall biosynthesis